ncbi:aminotransferase class I/II-fold pyridoxal phosphate-dependent enzyme [Longirhabdus pacifica]|uniref:aminotransferase class I/II-fold pyridoxal phosphate-dependent enzyme n=1 Tax=Longirhabdus pacifica TaxID=2305227 RepID=UPI0013E8E534|nr:aminotransferase class I/II-fold pyridoxal phosphate-dependent enzyme [Longirhabdus pacifica]
MNQQQKMQQKKTPLYDELKNHYTKRPVSFHVPGHKYGQAYEHDFATYLPLLHIDATEITGLDNLQDPQEVIMEAEQLAAQCFGSDQTFFLVGGSTVGILGMLMAVCAPNDVLIVDRNIHQSVIHGLMLAKAKAVFLPVTIDEQYGLPCGIDPHHLKQALQQYPEAKGILTTNPNYYGISSSLEEIASIAHHHHKLLLVDEAHGAHFGFHPNIPSSALEQGADIVVQSTHKMLTSMTMGAMLHTQGEHANALPIRKALNMVQSSSPSYPILASLDIARKQIVVDGKHLIDKSLQHITQLLKDIDSLPAIQYIKQQHNTDKKLDPFKLMLYDATGILSGKELQKQLEHRGCFVELATSRYVLIVFSIATTQQDLKRLSDALKDIVHQYKLRSEKRETATYSVHFDQEITEVLSFTSPLHQNQPIHQKHILKSIGYYAKNMIVPYPPGVPLLYAGQQITEKIAHQLMHILQEGSSVIGLSGNEILDVYERE